MKLLMATLLSIFLVHILYAQNAKQTSLSNLNKISIADSVIGKISIQNSTGDALLEINDESSGGSISIPPLSNIVNSVNKLYNIGNLLYWNGSPLGLTTNNGIWNNSNGNIYLSNSNNSIGIGTEFPQEKLHVENGKILISDTTDWFPGLTIKNEVGRSVLVLRGTRSNNNISSAQIAMTDLNTGYIWNLLHSNNNIFTLNSYDGTNYQSPFKVELGAPTNSITVNSSGNIGIGVWSDSHKLAVAGSIISEEVVVKLQSNWPDYVFEKDYKLPKLSEVEDFVKINKHLKGIPSAQEIKENGIDLAEVQIKLLEKIEQLTLYLIEQDSIINNLSNQLNILSNRIEEIK